PASRQCANGHVCPRREVRGSRREDSTTTEPTIRQHNSTDGSRRCRSFQELSPGRLLSFDLKKPIQANFQEIANLPLNTSQDKPRVLGARDALSFQQCCQP